MILLPGIVKDLAKSAIGGDLAAKDALHDLLLELGIPSDNWAIRVLSYKEAQSKLNGEFWYRGFLDKWTCYNPSTRLYEPLRPDSDLIGW